MTGYCPRCGQRTAQRQFGAASHPHCDSCGHTQWRSPSPSGAAIIPLNDGIVLIRRSVEPAIGAWALPSGYADYGESIEEAACREAAEETGLVVRAVGLVHVESFRAGEKEGLNVFYLVEPVGGSLRAGDDAADAAVHPIEAGSRIPFESHRRALARWRAGLVLPLGDPS